MPTSNQQLPDVKKVVEGLECSPSKHDSSGFYGGKPSINPTAHQGEAATTGTHLKTKTTEFQMTDRGRTLPNFKGQFAKKAQEI